jgi:hypothetical protein
MADDKHETMSEGQVLDHEGSTSPQQRRIQLTAEERQVLKECNSESFWFRCLPLGITFIATTQFLVMRGIMKPNPRFGALFKNLGAGLAAFVIGKMSYQSKCREKILKLENSALADSLRKARRWPDQITDSSSDDGEVYVGGAESDAPSKLRKRRNIAESDGGHVEQKGLDENLKPSMDRENYGRMSDANKDQMLKLSYDQLRSQNRGEYNLRANSKPGAERPDDHAGHSDHGQVGRRQADSSTTSPPRTSSKRNQYGDIIESPEP